MVCWGGRHQRLGPGRPACQPPAAGGTSPPIPPHHRPPHPPPPAPWYSSAAPAAAASPSACMPHTSINGVHRSALDESDVFVTCLNSLPTSPPLPIHKCLFLDMRTMHVRCPHPHAAQMLEPTATRQHLKCYISSTPGRTLFWHRSKCCNGGLSLKSYIICDPS